MSELCCAMVLCSEQTGIRDSFAFMKIGFELMEKK